MDWLLDVFATWLYGLKVIAITLAVIMFISGLDDFFIDVVYWVRRIKRKLSVYRRYPRMSYRELYKPDEKPLAIMVPAWNETGVIGNMAELAATTLDYENYHIFVGTYPNDPDTQRDVDEVCARFPNVHKVVCARPGPTSKADCLNNVLDAITQFERSANFAFAGFILHDAEDVISPMELRLFNYLVERKDLIQIPVYPFEREWTHFTSMTYIDGVEFYSKYGVNLQKKHDLTMKRNTLTTVLMLLGATMLQAQPRYDMQHINREQLDRGVVAIRSGNQVMVSWRTLTSDAVGQPFDVYRNGQKLNSKPLRQGGTFFVDEAPLTADATYEVRGGGKNGCYQLRADAPDGYLPIKLQKPADGVTPDGRTFGYTANDASVGDVDADGQYEILLKWDPTNAHDNAHDGYTGSTLLDCYRLDGTLLWRIDLGINIRSGAHYTPFIFYDLDGDGRAELMVRTSDGTRDGVGRVIGDANADYRHRAPADAENPKPEGEWVKYNKQGRPKTGRILTGNEYITVFDGLTGKALATKPYVPARGNLSDWGDNYANRSDRMLAAVGYLDGKHASAIFCRGYYTRTVLAAWDWDGHELKQHWVFDTNNEGVGKDGKPLHSYAGQGNHNLRVADVDGDGCDEITYGSMAVDHDGRGLYNTGMGHGDALHLMAFDPKSTELQVWDCHENRRDGSDFRNARTGEVIFKIPSANDVGRCMAADIDPTNPGLEMWSTDSHGIRNMKGEVLYTAEDPDDPQHKQHLKLGGRHLSVNFGIWWDGDLLRELLDHETVSKYDWQNHTIADVTKFEGVVFNNWTKSNPCLSADILGDWREEVIARTPDSSELRIFVSPIPTAYRINCLMEDIPYRLSTAAQNVGYNQPSEPGFYLGPDETVQPFLK